MNLIDRAVLVVVNVTTARLIEPERLEEQLRLVVKVILLVRRHFTRPWLAHLAVQAVFAQAEARKGRRRGNLAALSALGAHATSSSRCNAKNAHIGTEYKTDGPRTVHALAVDYDLSAVRRQLHYAPGQPAQRALAAASGWTLAPLDLVGSLAFRAWQDSRQDSARTSDRRTLRDTKKREGSNLRIYLS